MTSNLVKAAMAVMVAGAVGGCASWGNTHTASNDTARPHRGVVQTADDAAITAKVKAKFVADNVVKARKIDVDTVRGFVTLYGDVHSREEADRAVELARQTAGVTGVKSNLNVIG